MDAARAGAPSPQASGHLDDQPIIRHRRSARVRPSWSFRRQTDAPFDDDDDLSVGTPGRWRRDSERVDPRRAYWRVPMTDPLRVQPFEPTLLLGAVNFIDTIPGLMFISWYVTTLPAPEPSVHLLID